MMRFEPVHMGHILRKVISVLQSLLDDWLRKTIRVQDDSIFTEIIPPLKEVRRLRQKPATAFKKTSMIPHTTLNRMS
jgi:hypothetical protein